MSNNPRATVCGTLKKTGETQWGLQIEFCWYVPGEVTCDSSRASPRGSAIRPNGKCG